MQEQLKPRPASVSEPGRGLSLSQQRVYPLIATLVDAPAALVHLRRRDAIPLRPRAASVSIAPFDPIHPDPHVQPRMSIPIALTIAGSDSGGGAGIQADLKTFHAFGCFGTSAVTAITVQNTRGVTGVHAIPVDTVRAQIAAVATDLPPAACKTGMLATSDLVRAVAGSIREHALPNYVLDPVMVATSGDPLLDADAQRTIVDELLPLAACVTPNLDEAEILVGFAVRDVDAMRRAARALVERGAGSALLKGGHLHSAELVDVLFDGTEWHEWRRPKLDTRSTHGTGCTLSAAIAAGLAHGRPLRQAVEEALDYVQRALAAAPGLGSGHGPLNHLVAGRVPDG